MSHNDDESGSESSSSGDFDIDTAVDNLREEMNEYYVWRDQTDQRLDNIETALRHLHTLLITPNIDNNNVARAGGGKRKRKRKTKKRRKKKTKKKRKTKRKKSRKKK